MTENKNSPYVFSHMATIMLENNTIEDSCFPCEIAKTLREYADAIERHEAGYLGGHSKYPVEIFDSTNGTKLTCIAGSWIGHRGAKPDKGLRQVLVPKGGTSL